MTNSIKLIAATLVTLVATSAATSALDLKIGGDTKITATKIQLGIKSPADNVCPGDASFNIWVFSDKPGVVPVLIVRKGGAVTGPHLIETHKGANGLNMGTYAQQLNIVAPVDAEYRILTPNSDVASNWVKLKADC